MTTRTPRTIRTSLVVAAVWVFAHPLPARAQETPQLPPPPPPSSPPQYTPPPTPPGSPASPPRREKEPPPRREKERGEKDRGERERDKEKERERERDQAALRQRHEAPPPPPSRDEPPPAARSYQIAVRSGISIPAGSISGAANDPMSGDFNAQVPIFIEAGIKLHPMFFLGAYTALSFGGTSSSFANGQGCTPGGQRSCLASDFRIGLEVQVHLRPAERINPWIGYGFGFEEVSASASGGGAPATGESFSGLEPVRLAGGVDFRVSRLFGFGPFVGIDFGSYSHEHVQGASTVIDQGIGSGGLHEWLTFGVRGVLFP